MAIIALHQRRITGRTAIFGVAMPEATLRMLSASLWDLRSLCEQQVRALTDAQRLAHQFQKQTATQATTKRLLVSEFNTVLRVTALVRESAEECAGLLRQLPVVDAQAQQT